MRDLLLGWCSVDLNPVNFTVLVKLSNSRSRSDDRPEYDTARIRVVHIFYFTKTDAEENALRRPRHHRQSMISTKIKSEVTSEEEITDVWLKQISGVKIAQGAEGAVYRVSFLERAAICKVRFSKRYRHPVLDRRLTSRRLTQEARALLRLRKEGLQVPCVYYVDCRTHSIVMEDVKGRTLREYLDSPEGVLHGPAVMARAGDAVAKMHLADVIHGDLTTSNIIVRDGAAFGAGSSSAAEFSADVCLIDFGLSSSPASTEDMAVDLYVLERAVISAHSSMAQKLNEAFQVMYLCTSSNGSVMRRLDEVRGRGRKRDMTG